MRSFFLKYTLSYVTPPWAPWLSKTLPLGPLAHFTPAQEAPFSSHGCDLGRTREGAHHPLQRLPSWDCPGSGGPTAVTWGAHRKVPITPFRDCLPGTALAQEAPRLWPRAHTGRCPPLPSETAFLGLPWHPVVTTSPSRAGGVGSTPGRGVKIPHALWPVN